jgi:hypothetical protein
VAVLAALLRRSMHSCLAEYEVNDAECLSQDPTLRLIGSEEICERRTALTCAYKRSGRNG